ncbi:MAG: 3'(2'),5'-bisphosphate nucleotidase [Alphaproteobacteria bacterium RBG_16_64_48]|nr:MAG: 3'(2'),5'-bisphosphate nucleotidase [Alphaproteobacteria bacterium RBG_16_64_48]
MSAPRQTTASASERSGGFDFARAASQLTDAASRAGAAIMRHFREAPEIEIKGDKSPVTRADRDSEAIILEALAQLAPDVRVVSEEACDGTIGPLPARFFLVDPLDGTKEFIKKRSDFTVNIALIEDGAPRFGLVYAPARALLAVTTAQGQAVEAELPPNASGADLSRLDQKVLHARPANKEGLIALVSLSHLDPETEAFLAKLKIAERSGVGSSVKFLAIAKGEADVYPRFGPTMEWDTAAGQAVLEAAGGRVVDTNGAALRYGKTELGLRNPSFIAWGLKDASDRR